MGLRETELDRWLQRVRSVVIGMVVRAGAAASWSLLAGQEEPERVAEIQPGHEFYRLSKRGLATLSTATPQHRDF